MIDPITIGLLITVGTLLIERVYSIISKQRRFRSSCCGGEVEMENRGEDEKTH